MELTVKDIQALAKIVVNEKLDSLEYGNLKIVKTRHETPKTSSQSITNSAFLSDEELMFASTMAPALTQEELEALAVNPPPRKNKKDS
jgi:hypothetical protein